MAGSGLRWSLALAIAAALTAPAGAGVVGQCVKTSAVEYRECKGDCKDDYKTVKDACINKDHVCVDACREERAECRDATGFDAEIDACNADRDAAIANCKVLYGAGTDERDTCIDNAQLDAFQCRDQVREDTKPELKACRKAFRSCVGICPAGAGPIDDPRTCKSDAKADYKVCKGDCREDFQIAKDACRNRDHDCVEECRTDRQACRAPILATLDAAIAACKAAKQTAIGLCDGDDACIDQAQAVAFVCRDDAREVARPDLKACREGFRACAQSCPAASPSGAFLDG